MKVLYLCASQFSGTTLASFLLNDHSEISTIGHTTGWRYAEGEDFRCSCGERIADCRLFRLVRKRFRENGLSFDPRYFGTEFRLSRNPRANQLMLGPLPHLRHNRLEQIRLHLLKKTPPFSLVLKRQYQANQVLMDTVLEFFGSSVYLDNSHSPYRLRLLADYPHFRTLPIHLIRDPRGVVLSMMTNSGFDIRQATKNWLSHQCNIIRIAECCGSPLRLTYEDLCNNPDRQLYRIHAHAGLASEPFSGGLKNQEHHILGNRMRLSSTGIRLDERWKSDLSPSDVEIVNRQLIEFMTANPRHELNAILDAYLKR